MDLAMNHSKLNFVPLHQSLFGYLFDFTYSFIYTLGMHLVILPGSKDSKLYSYHGT